MGFLCRNAIAYFILYKMFLRLSEILMKIIIPGGRQQRHRRRSSDSSTSSDYTTSSVDTSSDEELRELDERLNGGGRDNPFTVPKIVVQPNSPLPPGAAAETGAAKCEENVQF